VGEEKVGEEKVAGTESALGMGLAAGGAFPPVAGALFQEAIDVWAVLNALRAAWPPRALSDFD